jgi:hypothetical protein
MAMKNTENGTPSFGRPASSGANVALVQSATCHLIEAEARAAVAALRAKKHS